MFDGPFQHYLSYGSTDQKTVRDLHGDIDGLLVPGTVAAFQKDGTGGFVLSLSALAKIPYVIDPRFPLFQQTLTSPKKSHEALATDIFETPWLVEKDATPEPSSFTDPVIDKIAERWAKFNTGYKDHRSAKFEKYSKRLGEEIAKDDASGPNVVLAPYFMAEGPEDAWWSISTKLFDRTTHHVGKAATCIRVVAAKEPSVLASLIESSGQRRVAVWVNALNEHRSSASSLGSYLKSLRLASENGVSTFALYGGFFSVVCSIAGLKGSSHGIGFGDHREYLELPESGPPPARYYVPLIHRYVAQEVAIKLWQADGNLVKCDCGVCKSKSIVDLSYHDLMKHSVHCRTREIAEWVGVPAADMGKRLSEEQERFLKLVAASTKTTDLFKSEAVLLVSHLPSWIEAITSFSKGGRA